jgi:hypothetical protein
VIFLEVLRTSAERAFYELREGSGWLPILASTDDPTNDGQLHDDEQAIAAWIDARQPDRQPFGTLADGTVMYGGFDTTKAGAGVRSGCVTVNTSAMMLTADCDGFVSGENRRGDEWSINFDRASLDEIRALRAFLNSDAIERMLVAAVAWRYGDSEPPAFAEPQSDYRRGWDDGLTAVFERA